MPHGAFSVLIQLAGLALVLSGLWDVFNTVFHPTRSGTISDGIASMVWKVLRPRRSASMLVLAGPLATVLIIVYWVASLVLGCAFIFWVHLRSDFAAAPGVDPNTHAHFVDALAYSFSSAITESSGFTPVRARFALLANLEALAAFGVLTASISWLLAIYPVLKHRRNVAHRVAIVRRAAEHLGEDAFDEDPSAVAELLRDFTVDLITLRTELGQFPITFYFHDEDPRSSLATALEFLEALAARAR